MSEIIMYYIHVHLTAIQVQELLGDTRKASRLESVRIPFIPRYPYSLTTTISPPLAHDHPELTACVEDWTLPVLPANTSVVLSLIKLNDYMRNILSHTVDVTKIFELVHFVRSAAYDDMFYSLLSTHPSTCIDIGWSDLVTIHGSHTEIMFTSDLHTIVISVSNNLSQAHSVAVAMCNKYCETYNCMQILVTVDRSNKVVIATLDDVTVLQLLRDIEFTTRLHSFLAY